jgi:hypothetical protein
MIQIKIHILEARLPCIPLGLLMWLFRQFRARARIDQGLDLARRVHPYFRAEARQANR